MGRSLHLLGLEHSEPHRRKKAVTGKEGRKASRLASSAIVSLTSWNTKAGITPLVELPLTFFLSSIKSLFRHLLWYFELHQKTLNFLPPESPAQNRCKMVISFKKTTACLRNTTISLILFCKMQEDYGRRMSQCV